jgi:hypothetical protein
MRRRLVLLLAPLLCAVALTGAAPSSSTTWALQPATAEGPDGRVSLRHEVDAGSGVADRVAVTNFGDRPATFALYAGGGTLTDDGNFDLLPPDATDPGAGSWITVLAVPGARPRADGGVVLEVAPGSTAVLPVQIDVPPDAAPGDHPAGVVAELVPDTAGGVQVASRVGVRVHLRVAGQVVADLGPDDVRASYSPSWNPFSRGSVTVRFDVVNQGNVRVGGDSVVSLTGPAGLAAASTTATQREVLPGESAAVSVRLPVTPLFRTSGQVASTPSVVGEDGLRAEMVGATSAFEVWTVPWSQLVLVLALAGAVAATVLLRRRSAARVQARIDAAVAEATARTPGTTGGGATQT